MEEQCGCEWLHVVPVHHAGARPLSERQGKSGRKSTLIEWPNSNQTVCDLFRDSKGPAAMLRAKLTAGGMLRGDADAAAVSYCIPPALASANTVN